jgi:hypothetical protein
MLQALNIHTQELPLPTLRAPLAARSRTRTWRQATRGKTEAGLLALYIAGWSEADPRKIADAAAIDYTFEDPLVGRFCRHSLAEYFDIVRGRFAISGPTARKDLAFALRGPMQGLAGRRRGHCWREFSREAPALGLTGIAKIAVTPKGIIADAVAYDLNMATEVLRASVLNPRFARSAWQSDLRTSGSRGH